MAELNTCRIQKISDYWQNPQYNALQRDGNEGDEGNEIPVITARLGGNGPHTEIPS